MRCWSNGRVLIKTEPPKHSPMAPYQQLVQLPARLDTQSAQVSRLDWWEVAKDEGRGVGTWEAKDMAFWISEQQPGGERSLNAQCNHMHAWMRGRKWCGQGTHKRACAPAAAAVLIMAQRSACL